MSLVQKKAPEFAADAVMADGSFKNLKLADYKGKWVVLFFYPLDFTFVCPTEIIAFSDRIKDFHALGAEVIGVSVDSHFTHLAWRNTPRNDSIHGSYRHHRRRHGSSGGRAQFWPLVLNSSGGAPTSIPNANTSCQIQPSAPSRLIPTARSWMIPASPAAKRPASDS